MNSILVRKCPTEVAINTGKKIEVRSQQALRRLSELEAAARLGGGAGLAWHIMQALRSGASLPEIQAAVERGMEMHGVQRSVLTSFADEWVREFGDRGYLRPARRTNAAMRFLCCGLRSRRCP